MATATATIKGIKVSPIKMAELANAIKNKNIDKAKWIVENSNKSYKNFYLHALSNAFAMLKDKGVVNSENIVVKNATINQGQRLKRFRPGSRGYSYTYKHSLSHLAVTLIDGQPKTKNSLKDKKDKNIRSTKQEARNKT